MPRKSPHSHTETVYVLGQTIKITVRPNSKADPYYRIDYYRPDGVRRRPPTYTTEKAIAVQILRDYIKNELPDEIAQAIENLKPKKNGNGIVGVDADGGPRLRDLADWYLHTHLPLHAKPSTIYKYRTIIESFVTYCAGRRIGRTNQLSFRIIQEWQIWLAENTPGGNARSTQRDKAATIRAWLSKAEELGELPKSPIVKWHIGKKKKHRPKAVPWSAVIESLKILQERSPSIWNAARFLAYSAWAYSDMADFRIGELRLAKNAIDRDRIKTEDQILYPLTPILREIIDFELARHPNPTDPKAHIFTNASGSPWTYDAFYLRLTRALDNAGFEYKITPHVYRTSFATHAANSGMPPKVLQNLLAHRDVKTTLEWYTEVSMDQLSKWHQKITDTH